ncbi:MAG: hypothetical protein ABJA02_08000 [Acidobacteriota bacterium]
MKRYGSTALILGLLFAASALAARAQNETFSSPSVDYSFTLPDAKWKMTVKPSETSPNVEYVYIDRSDGHLEVRKISTRKEVLLSDAIRDEEQKLQFLPGYVGGKEENFAGKHRGIVFNFEFVRTGRPMSGRMYFLRVNDTTIYVLRFTGMKDKLRSIQNQTDSIARTFTVG